ncbi:MAG: lipid-A-disaccharide synthase [Desulfuromonadaceae bacterium]|nr:lipid-A-disaccharide synthase [Desulfuromonadaceae bacterium]MDD2848206.1 lipid-A-disaccharide synthase [Desulfuromonadaceae bacterium]MDD4130627.1 lipid-A-disaccharide synthase [Desulfuromonadaceae bacterium]
MIPLCGATGTMPSGTPLPRRVMIVAGEASGDIYGADLVQKALLQDSGLHFFGIGGDLMREAGVETLVDSADIAVMGLVEVLKHFGVISSAFLRLKKILREDPPELLILIDYPGFNIRLAKAAKKAGVQVLYYISPKVWAWKAGRIKTIAANTSHMAVIFPFEIPLYEKEGAPVTFVGHPMLDLINVTMNRDEAAASFGLDPSRKIIGIFPGSRRSEIERILPAIVAAAESLQKECPEVQFVLPLASTLSEEDILPHLKRSGISATITRKRIHDLIRACDAIISVSGTVTLEIALIGTPMVIIYKLAPLTYQIAKRVVKIEHIGLCNIVAGRSLVKELIQEQANPEAITAEIMNIITDDGYRAAMTANLATIRDKLGGGGAAQRTASLALDLINRKQDI